MNLASKIFNHFNRNPCFIWRTRTWGNNQKFWIQFFLNLHHGIVMFKHIICQSFKKFHRAVFSIAHPKYSNFGGILKASF
jgi:hypothetical protein